MNRYTKLILLYILLVILIIGCSILFSSCTVLKKRHSTSKDRTQMTNIDTGQVRRNITTGKDSSAWWREVINFGRDTTIYHNTTTVPVNNYYPTQIIREGGTQKIETTQINYDSIWSKRMDSLTVRMATKDNSTKTTVFGFWQILAIAAGVGLVFFIIGKLKISFK